MPNISNGHERAILAGVHTGGRDALSDTTDESLEELSALAETAGAEVVSTMLQNRSRICAATYIGSGKLEELKAAAEELSADLLIFDDDLTGSQLRNIQNLTEIRTIDRSALILDIFAARASSNEGKLQVELAQLKYSLTRLVGMGSILSRLGGGIGTRGPGETKLETDRRHIRRRIGALEGELREVVRHRGLIRARRKKEGVLTAALVGYTNAGKSSLLNALTGADAVAEDKLFATLDPLARNLTLPDGREVLLIDTVGFIRKLPHQLINAFKSTLEETVSADVIIHVIDSQSPRVGEEVRVVDALLSELGCGDKPIIAALNKSDIAPEGAPKPQGNFDFFLPISALRKTGLDELLAVLSEVLNEGRKKVRLLIPYGDLSVLSGIRKTARLMSEEYQDDGVLIEAMLSAGELKGLDKFLRD